MHVFFEEDGGFKAATIRDAASAAEASSHQVELPTGRRIKIKAANVLFQFSQPEPAELLRDAEALAIEIDIDFLWEAAPRDEFNATELGKEYFGAAPSAVQSAALLMRLQNAPMYFRRKGKGRYKPASADELRAALEGMKRKQKLAALQAELVEQLKTGGAPDEWRQPVSGALAGPIKAAWLLFKPDKNSVEYKAIEQAAKDTQATPIDLLMRANVFANALALHRARFDVEWFPKGSGFDAAVSAWTTPVVELPLADRQAFSIDDSQTTEIDDAFSVSWEVVDGMQQIRVGIHIAAPGLGMRPDDVADHAARQRLSTVYMPGEKITMLPDAVVAAFTLSEGAPRPALSLYADFDAQTGACLATETKLERVPIVANLRYDTLDAIVTEAALEADDGSEFAFQRELQALWKLGRFLSAQREQVRGKPEPRNRADFNFRIETIDGRQQVRITRRQRDAPLDRIVAEWMIFANSQWGRALDEAGIPGIYRTQTFFARPGSKQSAVRMTTAAGPHLGLGVLHYAWSSSPLRRYVDLVNQWQLIAWAQSEPPPFEKNSADLFAIIAGFDTAYSAYAETQATMEKYWCLRWLAQQDCIGSGKALDAVVLRNELVRLNDLPLVSRCGGIAHLAPGAAISVEVLAVDELALTADLRLVAVLTEAASPETEVDETDVDLDDADPAQADAKTAATPSDGELTESTGDVRPVDDAPTQ